MCTRLQHKGGYGGAAAPHILGIIFNTFRGRIYITKEKFDKLMALLWEIMQLLMCSPRGMAELRGKAQHQMRCMERVRPFLVRLNQFIGGPRTTYEWDKQQPVSEELRHVLGFLYQQLPMCQAEGAEMWPMQPCTVY